MLAGQGEKLPHQALAARCRLGDLGESSASGPPRTSSPTSSACNRDGRQGIVEFVGHARQHRAHGRQLLLLEEGLLLLLHLGRGALAFHWPGRAAYQSASWPPAGPCSAPAPRWHRTPAPPPPRLPPTRASHPSAEPGCLGRVPALKGGIGRHIAPPLGLATGAHPPDQVLASGTLKPLRGLLEATKRSGSSRCQMAVGAHRSAWGHGQIHVADGPACKGTEAIHSILQASALLEASLAARVTSRISARRAVRSSTRCSRVAWACCSALRPASGL